MFRVRSRKLPEGVGRLLGLLPFLAIVLAYAYFSHQRLSENPRDKLLPGREGFSRGWEEVTKLRTGEYIEYTVREGDTRESIARRISGSAAFADQIRPSDAEITAGAEIEVPKTERYIIKDTLASLRRLAVGMLIGIIVSLTLGLSMGVFTPVEKMFYPLVAALSKIPPLAILPIIFIFQGVGESAKITIIALGIAPVMTMDILLRCKEVASELITKAYTLGASTMEVVFKVVLPQIWPSFLNSVRISLGPAWVFL
ncbi:MAG: ABC transporter permease subunit, partial [Verrucomicrobiales bacterium]|nr:ABC transporter permease subunit [Verrucomicrobiales bacterium]